ncbi:MAG: S8 family serine peptidase [Chlorobi bacterium]|nr:S8 family serine peptidase [Chlorobiota bacterium]
MTGKRHICLLIVILVFQVMQLTAQHTPGFYFIRFTDKNGSAFSIDYPEAFLSQKAIDRRIRQNIPVTVEDLPLSSLYTDSLHSLGLDIHAKTKWMNAVTVRTSDTALLDTLEKLDFIASVERTRPLTIKKSLIKKWRDNLTKNANSTFSETGITSLKQLSMLNGDQLHDLGYTGKGITIAILDAGFYHANALPAFDSLFTGNQILGTYDFVSGDSEVYNDHAHGMYVLSLLGGNIPGQLIGSAPGADYWLLRSEDALTEYIIEEDYWTMAAEFADSAGADIISSSLGYFLFDDSTQNHTYQDMNGRTTRVARAAAMAAARGIIVVASAGNEALSSWHYIISPADADSILAVGAVDSLNNVASFSSKGPSSDGRVKPDVSAMGVQDIIQGSSGTLVRGNGTSFSAPIISGLTACLWQAFPDAGALEIIETIKQSADHFNNPDNDTGYGTPDYLLAFSQLSSIRHLNPAKEAMVFPNPFSNQLFIALSDSQNTLLTLTFYDLTGKILLKEQLKRSSPNQIIIITDHLSGLPAGFLILRISGKNLELSLKIIKE